MMYNFRIFSGKDKSQDIFTTVYPTAKTCKSSLNRHTLTLGSDTAIWKQAVCQAPSMSSYIAPTPKTVFLNIPSRRLLRCPVQPKFTHPEVFRGKNLRSIWFLNYSHTPTHIHFFWIHVQVRDPAPPLNLRSCKNVSVFYSLLRYSGRLLISKERERVF